MRILKFGGKSLSSIQKMQRICKFIKKVYEQDKQIIVVVSAMGKTTDELEALSKQICDKNLSAREQAVLLSTGETISSALFAMTLESLAVPAESFQAFQLQITTFGSMTDSKIAYINKSNILQCLKENKVAVVAGFQGINSNNEITTLGRGGSDTTASAIGAIFETPVEIYSDFDGVFSGDPRDLNFKKLKAVDYDTMLDMAEGGAKVMSARATEIAKKYGIDLISKSSSKPENCGTIISNIECDILSISVLDKLSQITITISNPERLEKVIKNVLICLKKYKFYNFSVKQHKIIFLIDSANRVQLVAELSKKLKIVKNK